MDDIKLAVADGLSTIGTGVFIQKKERKLELFPLLKVYIST